MRISDLLKKETMILNVTAISKAGVIDELVTKLDRAGRLHNREEFKKAILAREAQTTTGIGEGIAIPHAKSAAVKTPAIAFGRSTAGIDYEALDNKPSHLFFMIAASEGANNEHLETLARLSTLLIDEDFRNSLLEARNEDEILVAIDRKEAEKAKEESTSYQSGGTRKKILAVTGCPTGIAHTYMAADALKQKAQELGIDIKVETNGSDGVKNQLTAKEIEEADAIVVTADTKIDMNRFAGKKVINTGVTDGIRKPKELLEKASSGDVPIYHGEDSSEKGPKQERQRTGFYKHLMNGVSNMLPFVVGGGILIALSFVFGIQAFDPEHESYHPIAELLMTIGGGNAFHLMIPVLAGFIAMSIADRPGLAPGMVGGLLALTGGAGFLGGIIAGFLAGYLVVLLRYVFKELPRSLGGIKTILIFPFFGILITGVIMSEVVVGPVSAFNMMLENWLGGMTTANAVLLGIILGGMMAVDMGGPINKAAFTFGIAMIDAGNFGPHAAIMAGGMVPPLGIALATTIFRNKFTLQEREAGKTNYIMGATFITEGAIPFAAADPGRVIPSIIVGSAIAGALTMMFGIGLPAPHGGIFVVWIVQGSVFLYLLAIIIGSVVTALLLGFLKKKVV
ncbi:PTS fructose transporter subunit IIABC [Bacillus alkalicellulosilyticus]|uniref:PTS fructose transporter subunit IIABC n=1 Tax=Alkalihalobacterium alkalicellulosilyticum TaxID=1912214 RepID=UPI000996E6E3|nr:PTS fructose transporter subunit IIABC [Bacillus alkalicellulosilyticus]